VADLRRQHADYLKWDPRIAGVQVTVDDTRADLTAADQKLASDQRGLARQQVAYAATLAETAPVAPRRTSGSAAAAGSAANSPRRVID
jgi:hypothetical protein